MENCLICGKPTKARHYDFCEKCLNAPVSELTERYLERQRASETREDHQETLSADNPLTEKPTSHRVS
jgi:hypothetical protein